MDENRIEPVKTRQRKFTLFLILVVSVTALVLVILVINGKWARSVFAEKVCVLLVRSQL